MRTTTFSAFDRIPDAARLYIARRAAELAGACIVAIAIAIALSLATWSAYDPSLNYAADGSVRNLLGSPGALLADLIMQMWGISALVLFAPVAYWGWLLLTHRRLDRVVTRVFLLLCGSICAAGLASLLPVTDRWPMPTGLGGVIGDAALALPRLILGTFSAGMVVVVLVFGICTIVSLSAASSSVAPLDEAEDSRLGRQATQSQRSSEEEDEAGEPSLALVSLGAAVHAAISVKTRLKRLLDRFRQSEHPRAVSPAPARDRNELRREPVFEDQFAPRSRDQAPSPVAAPRTELAPQPDTHRVVEPGPTPIKPGKRAVREAQPSLLKEDAFELPPLALLTEPKKSAVGTLSADSLEQNARLLEGVLDDFGVKGDIINVRPGPVVTLYELEPAPGIKSSRVIGLADDIARSMSAISARVAVVQGRNAIGIELPNQRRETVFLRELVASEDFEKTKHKLAIALGKTIGGEPVIVDLARMPHLLVAGTTGSGKSVAINTFILSLLYRLKPEECKLIMVDPKMLELSVYDGIPHLLTPVVTDPKKAVVALKWAVREMEDRYKKMSKVGVRNIDGFNARVAEAQSKGEVISRTVQTGFDRHTGEAIYEREEMVLAPLPYIVVIVDEMADLMMVAGKDIEGAIQRLAQMARAAGIHLIMATQRPSVDVITGTIKANFPTRISFQVTSKIDSRTILGEQGAEQLLGQGDMLYMAGGGRISRVHGPFVSDSEVEKIVAHLKTQGHPEYLEAITADDGFDPDAVADALSPGTMDSEEAGDLYDRAVAIVLRDGKCSTSYIQRRLSVGYNKAASLVERMETEGVVGPANHAGKREILVGGAVDRGAFELRED
ncbi:MAG: Cell division protein FtsK [Hyphomicrobiales bacterium]|nr:Cell division protein FtsK [Hyphomicrobiales bacterium]